MIPKPKVKKKKYSQLLADKYFSLLIRSRTRCEGNGKDKVNCGGPLQCAHIVSRTNKRLRYDENNALCLCAGHHRYYTTHQAEWWLDFLPNKFPKQLAYVNRWRNEVVKNNVMRLRNIIDALDQQLTALNIDH